ncbi:rhombosortase [Motiliproteus coralliicola]|uniref:Rhombosortase n=2 Tax=Motiliproteus coralliicola TaxID=2283196 RepID=A0A369W8G5_9GAMM|nr:rhombosortase [Motiliproteus coralliicola]
MMNRIRCSIPWVTLALAGVALGLALLPSRWVADPLALFCFDHQAIVQQGQWWRLLSGHLVHSDSTHLQWDLLGFVIFGSWLEFKDRRLLVLSLALALLILDLVLLSSWGLARYCGLSGLLYAPAALMLWQHFRRQPHLISALPLIAGAAKLVSESLQQQAWLADQGWPLYAPAHWCGVAAALIVWLLTRRRHSSPLGQPTLYR